MKREIRFSEKLLLIGYGIILLFMFVQDWIPIGSLNDVEAILEINSFDYVLTTTIINAGQILFIMGGILIFLGKKYPIWIKLWLITHPLCIFVGVLLSWWIPYFTGIGAAQKVERYQQMFGDTHSFLPVMNGIVPNTFHTIFHATLFICIVLTFYITLTDNKNIDIKER